MYWVVVDQTEWNSEPEPLFSFCFQDVHVHLPDWTGGSHAVRHVPGSGLQDGMEFNNLKTNQDLE